MFVFVSWLDTLKFVFACNSFCMWWEITPNSKYLLELINRRPKVQEINMSCEHALNIDQWKTFSENYKPMRVWLWLVTDLLRIIVTCDFSLS